MIYRLITCTFFGMCFMLYGHTNHNDSLAPLVNPLLNTVVSISSKVKISEKKSLPHHDLLLEFFGKHLPDAMQQFPQKKEQTVLGSGFFVDNEGHLVTNYHVIRSAYKKQGKITVILANKQEYDAQVVGCDEATDIALLKVAISPRLFSFVQWGQSQSARIGDRVFAIGNPFGLGGTVTSGIISNFSEEIGSHIGLSHVPSVIQTDASINSGNSGAPIFNMQGHVIGVATFIISPNGQNIGLNFGIPSDTVQHVVQQIKKNRYVKRAWFGIHFRALDQEMAESVDLKKGDNKKYQGIFVHDVVKGSPAYKGNIQKGDIILSVGPHSLTNLAQFAYIVGALPIGKSVEVKVWRYDTQAKKYALHSCYVKAEEAQNNTPQHPLQNKPKHSAHRKQNSMLCGLTLKEVIRQNRVYLVITDMQGANQKLRHQGVKPGHVIITADNQKVSRITDLTNVINNAKKLGKKFILLWLSAPVKNQENSKRHVQESLAVPLNIETS